MPERSLSASHFLAKAATNGFLALKLDEIWSLAVAGLLADLQPGGIPDDAFMLGLTSLEDDLERSLQQMRSDAADLAGYSERYAEAADETLMAVLWGELLSPALRDELRWWVPHHGGLQNMARHFVEVAAEVDRELEGLRDLSKRLLAGERVSGGLSRKFKCGIVQGLTVAGVLSLPSGVLGLPTAAAVAAIKSGEAAAGIAIVGAAALLAQKLSC